ncbi:MAG: polysaccharide biosynthesis protein [Clostridiales Family XIII bacterium]|jgi:stage V sporulation protein B|nr:polysaccharide biosynthesis protein [Clostridiales Family XIII bacterium]
MRKKTFLTGAAILGAAGLIVQMMGAVFRIPLANIIGEVGMGYYQTAYPVYIFLLVFSTNGAPAAISKMTSERIAAGRRAEAHRVFRLAFVVMLAFGLAAALGVALFAAPLAHFVKSEGSYFSLLAIAPSLLFVPLMSVFRGYFQGMQEMRPTAVSQLFEQAIRVGVGLGLAVFFVSDSLELASAGACFGASVGPVAGILILIVIYARRKRRAGGSPAPAPLARGRTPDGAGRATNGAGHETDAGGESAGALLKTLVALTVPTTIGISILPIMNVVDMLLCRIRLIDAGFGALEAEGLYGLMAGFAAPIINIPMALALSIALSMVPAVAAACGAGDRDFLDTNIRMGLRTAMIIGVPCALGLMLLAEPILRLIYPAQTVAISAAPCLAILGAGVVFLCVAQAMAGILQGLGRASLPVVSLLAGLAVKFALTYALTALPALNINGAALGSTAGYAVVGILNLVFVKRAAGVRFDAMLSVVKPLASGALMCVALGIVYFVCRIFLSLGMSTLAAIGAAAVAYVPAILKSGAVLPHEVELLPKGKALAALLRKLRLI